MHGVVVAGCIAAAGPVADGGFSVSITNWPEGDQKILLSALPPSLFPRGASRLANDMEAGAIGLLALQKQGKLAESFKPLWKTGMTSQLDHQKGVFTISEGQSVTLVEGGPQNLVLAVGTGLGNAGLSVGLTPVVTPLEGGHSPIIPCAPLAAGAEKERALLSFLSRKVWEGKHPPEWEEVLSGRGIGYIYDWLTQVAVPHC